MKKVPLLTAIALTLLASACTVTVGEKFDDDDADFSDDPDFVDNADDTDEDASNVDTDTDQTTDPGTSSTVNPTTTGVDTSTTGDEDAGATDTTGASTTSDETSSVSPVNPVNPVPAECTAQGQQDLCPECLHLSCASDWAACCGEPNCVMVWNQITTCMLDAMSDDPAQDLDACSEAAAPDMEALQLSDAIINLISCVNTPFEGMDGDDPLGRQPGDGTCTLACYNAFAVVEP
jgi:hypothetical protein